VTRTVLELADGALLVGCADPVGLQRWIRTWQRRTELVPGVVVPVVNRVRASAVGAPASRRVAETVRRFAGVEDPVLLPEDTAADAALLAGRTLGEGSPRSALRRALVVLAGDLDALVPVPDPVGDVAAHPGFDPLLACS
jgi:hypothetical protein